MEDEKTNEIQERLLKFSVDIILVLRKLNDTVENKVIKYQLIKSASSSGANYEEAQAASSKADFINKVKISLKEARESNYWIKILVAINNDQSIQPNLMKLLNESSQLKKILGSIASRSTNNLNSQK